MGYRMQIAAARAGLAPARARGRGVDGMVAAGDVYSKTVDGTLELSARKLKLAAPLRTMLVLVDGHQPARVLREGAVKLGAPPDFMEQLRGLGLVMKTGKVRLGAGQEAPPDVMPVLHTPHEDFFQHRAAKDFMHVAVENALGLRAYFFSFKLERAGTLAQLRALIGSFHHAIMKGHGLVEADVLTQRLREMLA